MYALLFHYLTKIILIWFFEKELQEEFEHLQV